MGGRSPEGITTFCGPSSLPEHRLPGPVGARNLPRQDGGLNVVNPHQAAGRGTAPLEASGIRPPVEQRDAPGEHVASSLVVDKAVIARAARRQQPAARQPAIVRSGAGGLELSSGVSDVERRSTEQVLQGVRDAERETGDRCHRSETFVLQMSPERSRYRQRGINSFTRTRAQPQACADAGDSYAASKESETSHRIGSNCASAAAACMWGIARGFFRMFSKAAMLSHWA